MRAVRYAPVVHFTIHKTRKNKISIGLAQVNYSACIRCNLCVAACPEHAFTEVTVLAEGLFPQVDVQKCSGCEKCRSFVLITPMVLLKFIQQDNERNFKNFLENLFHFENRTCNKSDSSDSECRKDLLQLCRFCAYCQRYIRIIHGLICRYDRREAISFLLALCPTCGELPRSYRAH